MIHSLVHLFGYGLLTVLAIFFITWLMQLYTKNAAIVDGVWATSFPVLAATYFFLTDGYMPRKILMLSMVFLWGSRLAIYLFMRTVGHAEDVRYTVLRTEWGRNQNIFMLRFYWYQAILALALSLPFALTMLNSSNEIKLWECIGVTLLVLSVAGETIADNQMHRFRKTGGNRGKVCNIGLWKYSRHPNYFFEWMVWVAFSVTAFASPLGEFAVLCPAAILYFLLKVTGIPYTEAQLLKSRGKAYEEYQRTTSAFIPLPPKIK